MFSGALYPGKVGIMKLRTGLAAVLSLWPLTALAAFAGPVEIDVRNVPDNTGMVRVALCSEDEFLKPTCKFHGEVQSGTPTVAITLDNVPEGVYAVQAYQDRNGNAKLDKSFFGIPQEPIGFSRNPVLRFGPPTFEQCAVKLTQGGGKLDVTLITR